MTKAERGEQHPPLWHPLPREGPGVSDLPSVWLLKHPQIFPSPHHIRVPGPSSGQGLPGCSRLGSAQCPAAGKVLARPVHTISSTRDFQGIKGFSREKSLCRRSRASPHPCSGSRPAQSPPEQSQDAKSLSARPSSNARQAAGQAWNRAGRQQRGRAGAGPEQPHCAPGANLRHAAPAQHRLHGKATGGR